MESWVRRCFLFLLLFLRCRARAWKRKSEPRERGEIHAAAASRRRRVRGSETVTEICERGGVGGGSPATKLYGRGWYIDRYGFVRSEKLNWRRSGSCGVFYFNVYMWGMLISVLFDAVGGIMFMMKWNNAWVGMEIDCRRCIEWIACFIIKRQSERKRFLLLLLCYFLEGKIL